MTSSSQILSPRLSYILVFVIAIFSLAVLVPWKYSQQALLIPTSKTSTDPQWLLAIFIAPDRFIRRDIIRSTWASRYQHLPYDFRFIVGNYSTSPWAPLIDAENSTHGDIWCLEDFGPETHETANLNKNMYFFNYMVQHQGTRTRRYDFVSKVDDDNWFNVPPYYDAFMAPRLPGGPKHNASALTWIGRPMHWEREYVFASGRIYTISWPLLEFFVEKHTIDPRNDYSEDQLMGFYLYNERISHEFVVMELEQAWDIGLEHVVDNRNGTMIIHSVKHDERLLELSSFFDGDGMWNGKLMSGLTNFNRTMKEVVDRIGWPSKEEMEQLKRERESDANEKAGTTADRGDPKDTLDYKLIRQKTNIEDRQEMGRMYPLNLAGNNASWGIG